MSAPGLCVRCGQNPANARYCETCADAILEALTHVVDYATDLRKQRDELARDFEDCARKLAEKGGTQ